MSDAAPKPEPLLQEVRADLDYLAGRFRKSKLKLIASSRGFHALLFYRCAHRLWRLRVPLLPLALTRMISILYSIDIDCRARLAGGMAIIHGSGTVIGGWSQIGPGTLVYHGVTLGIKGSRRQDGFPIIGANCTLGAGCKILGDITVGDGSIVGANVVLTESLPPHSLARVPPPIVTTLRPKDNKQAADVMADV